MADAEEEEEKVRVFVLEWREILRKREEQDIEEFLSAKEVHGQDWPPLLGHPSAQEASFEAHELANTATTCTPQSTSPTAERNIPETLEEAPPNPPEQRAEPESPQKESAPRDAPALGEEEPPLVAVQAELPGTQEAAAEPVVAEPPEEETATEAGAKPEAPKPEIEETEPRPRQPETSEVSEVPSTEPPKPVEEIKTEVTAASKPDPPKQLQEDSSKEITAAAGGNEAHGTEKQIDHEAVKAAAQRGAEVLSDLTKPLEYEVREAVTVHESPDPRSSPLGSLSPGQMVHGYPGSGWLRLKPSGSVRGWVHIGRSLAVQCLLPSIRTRFLEGVDVVWPGFKGLLKPDVKVVYIVEWRCKKSGAAGHAVCHKPQEVVSNMPPGKPFELHVAVRIRGPATPGADAPPEVRFAGLWIESKTLELTMEDEEDPESCLDPFGTARAGCLNCQCYGFIWRPGMEEQEDPDEENAQRLGLNADPESIKCMRCGDPFDSHARAGTPAAERLLESRPLRRYLVMHARVFVRSRRSTKGDALGALRRGTEVSGCLEGNWLHLSQESARAVNAMPRGAVNSKAKYVDAWVLIDGASVGFQTDLLVPEELAPADLREQIQQEEEERRKRLAAAKKEAAKPKIKAKDPSKSKEPVEVDSEDEAGAFRMDPLAGLMDSLYLKPVDFLVLKPQLPIHRRPSTSSRSLGQLKRGQIVSGWPQASWVLLQGKEGEKPTLSKAGWVLLDASSLGFGRQLLAQMPAVKDIQMVSEAAVLEWAKFPARTVEYQVEWAESDRDEPTVAVQRETMSMARVHELPPDSKLNFRLTARVYTAALERGGELFAEVVGPWEEGETGAAIEEMEEGNLCVDPLANLRGRCMDCGCRGFVLAEYGERPRTSDTLEEVVCRRCSCSCVRHFILGEFHYRNPNSTSSSRPSKEKEKERASPQVQKALPAPEEPKRPTTWRPEDATEEHQERLPFVLDKVGEAQSLYETLGVSPDAEKAAIRVAYRQVSLSIHPDKVQQLHSDDPDLRLQAENAFKVVSAAYEVLGDDKLRAEYDRKLRLTGATFLSRISGGRSNLTSIAFLKKFLSKEKGGFGWDLTSKPPGDWEEQAPGVYVRKAKQAEPSSQP
ncbi:Dnajc1 [Symbiodinium necroappetens]|uniref:Dnajc1 protein n=1 Tax=Symbiodinium necroappetens TaxID=1628268 RepID=A0A813BUJ1_9DINO|nr:Dnajc1 [Symbiodinium necroappetens]